MLVDKQVELADLQDGPLYALLDVMLVGIGMLLTVLVIAALVYVLPGQFTFWPSSGGLA